MTVSLLKFDKSFNKVFLPAFTCRSRSKLRESDANSLVKTGVLSIVLAFQIVTEQLNGEFLNFGLWITTVTCVCVAIIFAIIGALMAIVNTTLTPVETIAGRIGLFIWNSLSIVFSLTAMIAWITQFYLRLSSNVLVQEDRDNHWTSDGRAYLGYSFWFVIGSALSHVANIVLLVLVNADERRKYVKPLPTEKTNSAVLLY